MLPTCLAFAGVAGFCLWALAGWWFVTAIFSVAQTVWKLRVPFTLGWWGAVFPTGTFATAALAVARVLHSPALKAVGAATVCFQLLIWLFLVAMTVSRGWRNELFHAPCLSTPLPAAEEESLPPEAIALEAKLSRPPNPDFLAALAPLLREELASSLRSHAATNRTYTSRLQGTAAGALRARSVMHVPSHLVRDASLLQAAANTQRAASARALPPAASLLLAGGAAHMHMASQPRELNEHDWNVAAAAAAAHSPFAAVARRAAAAANDTQQAWNNTDNA